MAAYDKREQRFINITYEYVATRPTEIPFGRQINIDLTPREQYAVILTLPGVKYDPISTVKSIKK